MSLEPEFMPGDKVRVTGEWFRDWMPKETLTVKESWIRQRDFSHPAQRLVIFEETGTAIPQTALTSDFTAAQELWGIF